MLAEHEIVEAELRRLVEEHVDAIHRMDLDAVMSIYHPSVVSFDLVPPLQYVGDAKKRKAWADVFAAYRAPLGYEVRGLTITVGESLAFSHSLNRIDGVLKSGTRSGFWLRWTACFERVDCRWLIAHEQVSVPVEPEMAKAVLDLSP